MKNICKFSVYPSSLGFFVRSIGDCDLEPMERQRIKTADFAEIFWGLDGRGVFRGADKKDYILRPGWTWYYPPGSIHIYRPDHCRFHYRWLAIGGPDAGRLFASLKITAGLHNTGSCPIAWFEEIYRKISEPDTQFEVLNTAFSILIRIVRGNLGASRSNGNITASAVKTLIDELFCDPECSIASVAEHLGVHRTTVNRVFRSVYNIDVSEYLKSRRLQESLRLVHTTALPIAEIARRSGFSSGNYCIRMVRKVTGFTPGQLRHGSGLLMKSDD